MARAKSYPRNGNGRGIRWLREHVNYSSDECLIWPFGGANGYGSLGHLGKVCYAHRMMCELAYGAPPSPSHEAAHSCGRGNMGCVNPRHLSWKTRNENQLDRAEHGTKNIWGGRGRLTADEIQQIKDLRGKKKQREIAEMFGTSRANVSNIQLGRWGNRDNKGFHKYGNRYHAVVGHRGKERTVGIFDTPEEARAAYLAENDRIRQLLRS